jgi:anti-sigma factor RsiW
MRVRFYLDHRWAPDRFSARLDGELTAGQRRRMERHLGECAECRRVFAGLAAVVEALRQLPAARGGPEPAQVAASVRIEIGDPPNSVS